MSHAELSVWGISPKPRNQQSPALLSPGFLAQVGLPAPCRYLHTLKPPGDLLEALRFPPVTPNSSLCISLAFLMDRQIDTSCLTTHLGALLGSPAPQKDLFCPPFLPSSHPNLSSTDELICNSWNFPSCLQQEVCAPQKESAIRERSRTAITRDLKGPSV